MQSYLIFTNLEILYKTKGNCQYATVSDLQKRYLNYLHITDAEINQREVKPKIT